LGAGPNARGACAALRQLQRKETIVGKKNGLIGLSLGLLVLFSTPVPAQAPGAGASASGKLMALLALPDLLKTLDSIEAIAALIAPDEVQPGMLRAQLGGMLGDPTLENLDATRPVCLLVFTPQPGNPKPPVALYIPAKNAAPYDQMAAAFGAQAEFDSGTLIVAQTPEELAFGKAKLDTYKKVATQGLTEDLRLFVSLEDVMASYGFFIDMGVQQMLMMMEQGLQEAGGELGAAGQLETGLIAMRAYAKVLRSMLGQSKNVEIGLSLSKSDIDAKIVYRPKSRNSVAEFLGGSKPTRSPVFSHIAAPYSLAYVAQIDTARTKAFFETVLGDLSSSDPKLKELLTDDVKAVVTDYLSVFTGSVAATMGSGNSPFGYTFSATVKSETEVLSVLDKALKLYEPGGALNKLMSSMGLFTKASLAKSVRQSGGANVHCVAVDYDLGELPEESRKILDLMPKSYDLAVVGGFLVGSTTPETTDALIVRAKAGGGDVALKSFSHYGDGKNFYMDLDLAHVVESIVAFVPGGIDQDVEKALGALKDAPPVIASGSLHGGRAVKEFRIPVELITRIAKAAEGS
jgi:hypothetical protein